MEREEKIRVRQAVIVEGKYDKIKLESLVDGLILPTNGFALFRDRELRAFIKKLAAERGIIVLTDSDTAGFRIRAHLKGMIPAEQITNVFIPDIWGKERRKRAPSAEGKLGVEGMTPDALRKAFRDAGVAEDAPRQRTDPITRLDLYGDGFTGRPDSRALRRALYRRLGLPERLNVTAALPLLNSLLTKAEYRALAAELREAARE